MLLKRTLTAVLFAPVVIFVVLLSPTWLLAPIVALAVLAALWEWARLSGLRSRRTRGVLLGVTLAVLALLWWLRASPLWPFMLVVGVAWWALACLWLNHFAFAAAPTAENRNLKLLAGAFVLLPAFVGLLTIHGSEPPGHWHWWTLLALLIVWAADIGAYFSGRFLGKRKLAPNISPGKTWAGVYGAFVAGALVTVIGGWLLGATGWRLLGLALLAVFTVAASVVGDLVESLMKRHAKVKDSGRMFPGHGGLLDRMDSVFAAVPVFALGKLLLGL
ncbi:MAG TPA: phosphatidate cytidylyltransferase [Frateuria sp.]|uniref:phosphatidate cytidylyltransferase n=1 Tax=Frateuria sp. TaxID=2211372 RepID=UPI002DE816D3|nr:phosphatidate cytidylyltransferase [Frateuria sp.]